MRSATSLTTRSLAASLTIGAVVAAALAGTPAAASQPPPTAGAVGTSSAVSPALPDDLRLVRTTHSLLGTHTWYEQTLGGIPVVGGWYVVHRALDGSTSTADGRIDPRLLPSPAALDRRAVLPARAAVSAVTARPGAPDYLEAGSEGLSVLPAEGERPARLVYAVLTVNGHGSVRHYVDAASARVLARDAISQHAAEPRRKGKARVFDPNPVVGLQDEGIRDQKDANSAVPASAYRGVTIRHLHRDTLIGKWVEIINTDRPVRTDGDFRFSRANNRFEMVNAYYGVERIQGYLQSLGFTDANAERQKVKTDAFPVDNSFYEPATDRIMFGEGGVDDAEDLEVVWHEYGHAVQDAQVPGFGSREQAGAIGEGFGDYLAVTMSEPLSDDSATTPLACVMDWDATSYTAGAPHCLRRVDGTKVFPDDLDGEVHDDGEIWSRALWDIHLAVGRKKADTLIIEAQYSFTPGISFRVAAQTTVDTARALYGDTVAGQVQTAFVDRGILAT